MVAVLYAASRRAEGQRKERHKGKKLTSARDIYQLLVGEIGIPRRDFLYSVSFWEVRRIIRGYRRRDRLKHQLMAECVYAATFAMRNPEGKKVTDLFPSLFAEDDDEPAEMMSEEDKAELLELMANINKRERQ